MSGAPLIALRNLLAFRVSLLFFSIVSISCHFRLDYLFTGGTRAPLPHPLFEVKAGDGRFVSEGAVGANAFWR